MEPPKEFTELKEIIQHLFTGECPCYSCVKTRQQLELLEQWILKIKENSNGMADKTHKS